MKVPKPKKISVELTEVQWQTQVIDLAHALGYRVAHFRSVRVQKANGSIRYMTPVQADGQGFPDLVLVGHGRLIFTELKVGRNKLSASQAEWISALEDCQHQLIDHPLALSNGNAVLNMKGRRVKVKTIPEVYVWYPEQFDDVHSILKG